MSQRWDKVEARLDEYESQLDTIYRLYHIPVLAALMVFMLWVRVRHWERFVREDGTMFFIGNDAYYHYRTTNYVLENYPFNMPYDVWTGFDTGTRVGQFGTIFDQLIATAILIVGLGNPSEQTIDMVFFFAPAVFGVLCAIPVFYIGRRLGGRFGGVIAVVILALTPGMFLSRSMAGFTDHHVTETLFQAISLLAVMVMLTVAQRERPIYELVTARDFDALKNPILWGAIAGVATAIHIWNWPPGIFFVGILGFVFLVHLTLEYIKGHSPDHVAIPAAVMMLVVALLTLPFVRTTELSATDFTLVQPLIALTVGVGVLFMAGFARLWDGRDLPKTGYPAAIAGIGVVGVGIVAVALPDLFDFLISQFQRVAGLTGSDTAATIGEAQAVTDPVGFFFRSYGLAVYTAAFGFFVLLYRMASARRTKGEYTLITVFTVFMLLATLTQQRFDYYFVICVGALNAVVVQWVYQFIDLDDVRKDVRNAQPYQLLVVVAILFVIAGPLVVTGSAIGAADSMGQPGEIQNWEGSLEWLSEETPEVGAYGSGDDPRLDMYGTYERTDDFQYEDGEYGVMAWWDYGHWITVEGERIPVANPFQQNAREAADFLLADDEQDAINILDEDQGEGEGVRYVMVDYQLGFAGTQKYNAPATFETRHDVESSDLGITVFDPQIGQPLYGVHTQQAYETMRVQLYQHHGSAVEPSTFVTRFSPIETQGGQINPTEQGVAFPPDGPPIEQFDSPEEAAEAAAEDPNAIHGGVFGQPAERVDALEHFRLVHASQTAAPSPFARAFDQPASESWVKTFERVEGATIEGTGPANTEIQGVVEMEVGTTGERFTYVQYAETDADGNFEMTVPYSSTGYDEYGTDVGYTNVDVRANGSYEFVAFDDDALTAWTGSADVTEGQVLGEDDTVVEVELEEGDPPELPDPEDEEPDGDGVPDGEDATTDDPEGDAETEPRMAPPA